MFNQDISSSSFKANNDRKDIKNSNTEKKTKKFLIVDDDSITRKLLNEQLKQVFPGCTRILANDGEEAVKKFKEALNSTPFDLILMDYEMKPMDGRTAAQKIRDLNSATPIVCISSTIRNQQEWRDSDMGMDDFLTKPINKEALKLLIKKLVIGQSPLENVHDQVLNMSHR